ncbi:MAG: hypothetical protein NC218_10370 [Acetobacter sp.]|nr:hypothetical protein [Acetobacter sp.]
MDIEIANYHKKRRAFIILPKAGILWAEPGSILTHREILLTAGISTTKIEKIIKNCPRGYYLDNTLILYQGDVIKAGEKWELQPDNFPVVKKVFADLENILALNAETKIFLGVKCGILGTVWEQYNQVDINFFK